MEEIKNLRNFIPKIIGISKLPVLGSFMHIEKDLEGLDIDTLS
ncbi:hypothetical protein [Methanosarcina sp. UBA5]|nr:hypothetical protein [Methanosarcina sp. UBA5]